MVSPPVFSVICPNYNGSLYLDECLNSVLNQTIDDLELIVVDDGSTDDSLELLRGLERFDPRVRIEAQENAGSAVARNRGVGLATGRYIAFIDADDVWHPRKLEKQYRLLRGLTEPVACFSNFSVWFPEPDDRYLSPDEAFSQCDVVDEFTGVAVNQPAFIYHLLLQDVFVWTSTVVLPVEILESVGGFNEQYRKGQDYDLWLRIAARFPFLRYPSSLALYRQHTASITGKYIDRNYPAIIVEDAIRSYGLAGPDGQKVLESTMNSRLRKLWSDYADICQANRQYDAATNAMVNARQYQFRYTDSLRLLRVRLERLLHRVE